MSKHLIPDTWAAPVIAAGLGVEANEVQAILDEGIEPTLDNYAEIRRRVTERRALDSASGFA